METTMLGLYRAHKFRVKECAYGPGAALNAMLQEVLLKGLVVLGLAAAAAAGIVDNDTINSRKGNVDDTCLFQILLGFKGFVFSSSEDY